MAKRRVGKPTKGKEVYTPELVEEFCNRLMVGEPMAHICEDDHMPMHTTILLWIRTKPEFSEKYFQARRVQMELFVDEIIQISDDDSKDKIETVDKHGNKIWVSDKTRVFRDVLRVNSRKWLASKLAPMIYGDMARVQVTGAIGAYDITKLGDEELTQLEQILSQVAIATGQAATAALAGPVIEGELSPDDLVRPDDTDSSHPDPEGFALFGGYS